MPFKIPQEDQIFGLGNKKKKAEKKLKKADKALAKGNIAKAEKKLGKAIKKTAQAKSSDIPVLQDKIIATGDKIIQEKKTRQQFVENVSGAATPPTDPGMVAMEPSTPQGTGTAMPLPPMPEMPIGGGGGGWPEESTVIPQGEYVGEEVQEKMSEEADGEGGGFPWLIVILVVALIYFWPRISKTFKS